MRRPVEIDRATKVRSTPILILILLLLMIGMVTRRRRLDTTSVSYSCRNMSKTPTISDRQALKVGNPVLMWSGGQITVWRGGPDVWLTSNVVGDPVK